MRHPVFLKKKSEHLIGAEKVHAEMVVPKNVFPEKTDDWDKKATIQWSGLYLHILCDTLSSSEHFYVEHIIAHLIKF